MVINRVFSIQAWRYLVSGLTGRIGPRKQCPCCAQTEFTVVDRKFFHDLSRCENCGILFRYPGEPADQSHEFYQRQYQEPGLTTDLPDKKHLERLIETKFAGTEKDITRVLRLLSAFGVAPGSRVLDYGANWGYGVYQFKAAGYAADGYEISVPRAKYAAAFGVNLVTSMDSLKPSWDVVYSGHVLEHVPNPLATIHEHLKWIRPGGVFIAYTPNGSCTFRRKDYGAFHRLWCQVHPFLLTDEFVHKALGELPHYVGDSAAGPVARWIASGGTATGPLDTDELLIVARPGVAQSRSLPS